MVIVKRLKSGRDINYGYKNLLYKVLWKPIRPLFDFFRVVINILGNFHIKWK